MIKITSDSVFLVTGKSGVGKDYTIVPTYGISFFINRGFSARAVSISDVTKREYAAATSADLDRLLLDRLYKGEHRPALTAFFQAQVTQQPHLLEEHSLRAARGAADLHVLFVTGVRDEAPVAAFSHLVPSSRLVDVRVQASNSIRRAQRGCHESVRADQSDKTLNYRPNVIFGNDASSNEPWKDSPEKVYSRCCIWDLQRLADMVHP